MIGSVPAATLYWPCASVRMVLSPTVTTTLASGVPVAPSTTVPWRSLLVSVAGGAAAAGAADGRCCGGRCCCGRRCGWRFGLAFRLAGRLLGVCCRDKRKRGDKGENTLIAGGAPLRGAIFQLCGDDARRERAPGKENGVSRFGFPHFGAESSASKRAPRSASVTMERGSAIILSPRVTARRSIV